MPIPKRIPKDDPLGNYLREHGRSFKPQFLPGRFRQAPKNECFANALKLAKAVPDLYYAEGYARCAVMPRGMYIVQHAWCVDKEDNVVDPTWDSPERCEYFGLRFEKEAIEGKMPESSMLDEMRART